MSRLFSSILFMAAVGLTINTAHADGPAATPTTIVTKGSCPEGMVVVAGPHITFDTGTSDDDRQNIPAPPPGVCMQVSQTLILHAATPAPPPAPLLPSLDDEVEPIADEQPATATVQAQKPGRYTVGVMLGYPSKTFGALALVTLGGTFRRGELGELRLEGAAGMTNDHVGVFGGSVLIYGYLTSHWLIGVGPTLTYETTFSKTVEDPSARQLGLAGEIAYQVKINSPTDMGLEMFGRIGGMWERVDGPEMGPLKDSAQLPFLAGWRGRF